MLRDSSTLIQLPAELRLHIYSHLSYSSKSLHFTFRVHELHYVSAGGQRQDYRTLKSLMRTCKLIRAEIEDHIYSKINFKAVFGNLGIGQLDAGRSKTPTHNCKLDFLGVLQHVEIKIGITGNETVAPLLDTLSQLFGLLVMNDKIKTFVFTLHCWSIPGLEGKERLLHSRGQVLGSGACSVRTRNLLVAQEVLEKLKLVLESTSRATT